MTKWKRMRRGSTVILVMLCAIAVTGCRSTKAKSSSLNIMERAFATDMVPADSEGLASHGDLLKRLQAGASFLTPEQREKLAVAGVSTDTESLMARLKAAEDALKVKHGEIEKMQAEIERLRAAGAAP